MNKWLMLVVLVLMVLVSAFGLRNLATTQVVTPTVSASTGNPVPVFPSTGKLVASTGNPVPVFPSTGKGQ
jgi:hypothetical protein